MIKINYDKDLDLYNADFYTTDVVAHLEDSDFLKLLAKIYEWKDKLQEVLDVDDELFHDDDEGLSCFDADTYFTSRQEINMRIDYEKNRNYEKKQRDWEQTMNDFHTQVFNLL